MSSTQFVPAFVVVGHPNKGKSSIVATLAQDASVAIADESGTTRVAQRFPMRIDDTLLYELVDTPGFQRPRRVLAWLEDQAPAAHERPAAVASFVEAHTGSGRYDDECELLAPIMAGSPDEVGILYVVDGSVPYSDAYEAEMEVLRWSSRPRMALINPITASAQTDRYVAQWRTALDQYFSIVRVFNAVSGGFDKQMELLRAFGELNPAWNPPMRRALDALGQRRARQRQRANAAIARLLADACAHVETRQIALDANVEPARDELVERFRRHLRRAERRARESVEDIYGYERLEREEGSLELLQHDLFDEASMRLFGLTRAQALQVGVAGGAGAGLVGDLATFGASFGLAAVLGGVAGGAAAWFGYDGLARVDVVKMARLGVNEVRVGPLNNPSVRHALVTRALTHHAMVESRTHANRGALDLNEPVTLDDTTLKSLNKQLDVAAKANGDLARIESIEAEVVRLLDRAGRS